MKKIYLSILFISLLISSCSTKLEKDLDQIATDEGFNGSILIAVDNKILYSKGFGFADFEQQIPNEPSTKFLIGSVTKQFTAAGIMLLHDEGLLNISDPITEYLDYPTEDIITIEHLLSQNSGIPEYIFVDPNTVFDNMDRELTQEDLFKLVPQKTKESPPAGEVYEYCNSNFVLLGLILERVSGFSYSEFMEKRIFEPLNMINTGSRNDFLSLDNAALGYNSYTTESYQVRSGPSNLSLYRATGDIYSTVEDLYKWHVALNSDFLSEESKNSMFTARIEDYGLGWIVVEDREVVLHPGEGEGYVAYFLRHISENKAVIILSNVNKEAPARNVFWRSCELLGIEI